MCIPMNEIAANKVVETTAVVVRDPREVLIQGADDAARKLDFDNKMETVRRILRDPAMTTKLPGQREVFIRASGWRSIAANFGVFACATGAGRWVQDELTNEKAWYTTCEARNANGELIGVGDAAVSYGELTRKGNRKWSSMHAMVQMASTRAARSALRNSVDVFVVAVGGYSSTPAEDVEDHIEQMQTEANSEPLQARPASQGLSHRNQRVAEMRGPAPRGDDAAPAPAKLSVADLNTAAAANAALADLQAQPMAPGQEDRKPSVIAAFIAKVLDAHGETIAWNDEVERFETAAVDAFDEGEGSR